MCGQPLHDRARLTFIQHSLKHKAFEVKVHVQIKEISLRYGVLECHTPSRLSQTDITATTTFSWVTSSDFRNSCVRKIACAMLA